MGFKFRKSVKMGPVRVNLSKKGVGYSVGGKGFRFTKKAGGGTRTTTSIPGTGISYTKDSSAPKKAVSSSRTSGTTHNYSGGGSANSKNTIVELILCLFLGWAGVHKFYIGKKRLGILYLLTFGLFAIGWWGDLFSLILKNFGKNKGQELPPLKKILSYIAGFLCVMIIGGCGSETEMAPTEPSAVIATVTQETEAPTTVPVEESTTASTTEATTVPTTEATTVPTTEPTTEPATEPTTAPATEPIATEKEGINYVLNTNSRKFHYPSCSSADDIKASNRRDVVATREELIAQGYKPCGRCHP